MLQVTHAAAEALAQTRRAEGLPESHGVRLFGQPRSEGMALGITFAEVPADGDQVTERDGTHVFVAPEVAGPLASSALDVEDTPDGGKLVLRDQTDQDS